MEHENNTLAENISAPIVQEKMPQNNNVENSRARYAIGILSYFCSKQKVERSGSFTISGNRIPYSTKDDIKNALANAKGKAMHHMASLGVSASFLEKQEIQLNKDSIIVNTQVKCFTLNMGEYVENYTMKINMPIEDEANTSSKSASVKIKAVGGLITYAERYSLSSVFGFNNGEDVDAETSIFSNTNEKTPSRPRVVKAVVVEKTSSKLPTPENTDPFGM